MKILYLLGGRFTALPLRSSMACCLNCCLSAPSFSTSVLMVLSSTNAWTFDFIEHLQRGQRPDDRAEIHLSIQKWQNEWEQFNVVAYRKQYNYMKFTDRSIQTIDPCKLYLNKQLVADRTCELII